MWAVVCRSHAVRLRASGERRSKLGGAAAAPTAPQFTLRIHQAALDPRAKGAIAAHGIAVEELGERALDALVDVAELGLLDGHFCQYRLVQDGPELGE